MKVEVAVKVNVEPVDVPSDSTFDLRDGEALVSERGDGTFARLEVNGKMYSLNLLTGIFVPYKVRGARAPLVIESQGPSHTILREIPPGQPFWLLDRSGFATAPLLMVVQFNCTENPERLVLDVSTMKLTDLALDSDTVVVPCFGAQANVKVDREWYEGDPGAR